MMMRHPPSPRITYILCDIREGERLTHALHGADVLVHAAALKTVPAGEIHTVEFVKVNVLGTINVIFAAIANRVSKCLLISSDKCVQPINRYGMTKALSEGLFLSANLYGGDTIFSCARGGNVWASRGSVVRVWLESNPITVYNPTATRFHLEMQPWLKFCLRAVASMRGAEVFIPKCDAWMLGTLADAFLEIYRDRQRVDLSLGRYGDKNHEVLVSPYEASHTVDDEWAYIIEPSSEIQSARSYTPHANSYLTEAVDSSSARRMTVDELRTLIARDF